MAPGHPADRSQWLPTTVHVSKGPHAMSQSTSTSASRRRSLSSVSAAAASAGTASSQLQVMSHSQKSSSSDLLSSESGNVVTSLQLYPRLPCLCASKLHANKAGNREPGEAGTRNRNEKRASNSLTFDMSASASIATSSGRANGSQQYMMKSFGITCDALSQCCDFTTFVKMVCAKVICMSATQSSGSNGTLTTCTQMRAPSQFSNIPSGVPGK
mmetsp:Transcript_17662/g.31966  ORF Transcript_17662/g.31966 Transcript_17662/m.31966 type:complete len:214 (-) Transcript_17662:471-1112(-)